MTNADLSALSFQAFERLSVQKDNLFKTLKRETVSRGRSSGQIEVHVFEKILTDSPLLSSRHFSLIRYFTSRSLFCSSIRARAWHRHSAPWNRLSKPHPIQPHIPVKSK